MKSITCGICGFDHTLYGKSIEDKLVNFARKSNLIYKCKNCKAFLAIMRLDNAWKLRWLESVDVALANILSTQK